MATSEEQFERLEAYLDGEAPSDEAEALRRRLEREPALAAELDQLRAERATRITAFAAMEGDDGIADRLLAGIRSRSTAPAKRRWATPVRYGVAAAACLLLGFLAGRVLQAPNGRGLSQLTPAGHDDAYRVAITDDAGRIIAVQRFESLQQATEFSEDLRRWQERQEQIRNGQVTVRSASF